MSYFGRKVLFDGQLAFVNKENEDGSVNLFILGEHGQKLAHNQSPEELQFVATDNPPPDNGTVPMPDPRTKLTKKQAAEKAEKEAAAFLASQAGKDAAAKAQAEFDEDE